MRNIDRITEAYEGKLGIYMMEASRERIHWVCSQAKGETILDVGCSQGIVPILLAREGKYVKGIDISKESIIYANEALANEDDCTRAYVEFICVDFASYILADSTCFDCIIMSEVLEHLTDPERFIRYAHDRLKESGIFIATVPFGINDYHDHKRTYYITELYRTITKSFAVDNINFFDDWVGIVGIKTKNNNYISMDEHLFARTEQAFKVHERKLLNRINELKGTAEANKESAEQWREKAEEYASQLKERTGQLNEYENKLKNRSDQLKEASDAFNILKCEIENLKKHFDELQIQDNALQLRLQQQNNQYKALANSKLGRIQISVWQKRNKKKQEKNATKSTPKGIKQLLKQSPLLVFFVRKLRGQKISLKELQVKQKQAVRVKIQESTQPFDLDYIDRIEPMLRRIPVSTSGRFYRRSDQKVAMISDEFLFNTYKDVANCVALHPDQWRDQIQESDLLFIITGWRGIGEEWRGFGTKGTVKRGIILEIIEYSKSMGIPTVFYSIEDPPNYNSFIELAQCCDYVFTAASEMIPVYRRDCGHDRVYTLMFGINPLFHNPVGSQNAEKLREVVFSGSWYKRYPERGDDICTIFDGVISSSRGLKIIDRNFSLKNVDYIFPSKYAQYISPEVSHELLQKVHKLYDWAINLNTVKESPTMFANRVYELEASGNLLLSNYSVGVNANLPVVYTVQDSKEIRRILDTLSPDEIRERRAVGIRHAMTGNTCFDRYAELCSYIDLPTISQTRTVAVIVKEITEIARAQFERQSYPHKELIKEADLEACYSQFDMVTFFDDKVEYGEFYLEDMINGFKYTESDYITKDSYYIGDKLLEGRQHDFVKKLSSKYCTIFWTDVFDTQALLKMPEGQVSLPNGYSIDCLQYNAKPNVRQRPTRTYKISMVIPVYNNGLHLYGKAFGSLLRSSMFEDMEIILVDDGSTDGMTERYVQYLGKRYDNVRTFFFGDGGSGSASRPRNKGVEIASADYIAFLDPDNEAIEDGYAQLYENAVNEGYDLVIGNILCFREKQYLGDYYFWFKNVYGSDALIGDKKEFLNKISFTPMSIQAMIIEKKLIVESGLEQVPGAVGQDSFFSWQLIANAKRIKAVNLPVHIYYEMVKGSIVNTIGESFFKKTLLLEQAQFQWLQNEGLLKGYMEKRFNRFFRDWIIKKLSMCRNEEKDVCTEIVSNIFMIYHNHYNGDDEVINEFAKNIISLRS
ncbi:MAG: glycosyltransferase [Firmicutes bacterium]|nr:glycosyltransferase [Bacillota bacterium]